MHNTIKEVGVVAVSFAAKVVVVEITMKRNKGANKNVVDEIEVVEEVVAQIVQMLSVTIVKNIDTTQRIAMPRRRWKKTQN